MSTAFPYISPYKKIGQQLLDYHSIDMLRLIRHDLGYWVCRLTFKDTSNGKLVYSDKRAAKFMLGGYRRHEYLEVKAQSSAMLWRRLFTGLLASDKILSTVFVSRRENGVLMYKLPLFLSCHSIEELGMKLDVESDAMLN